MLTATTSFIGIASILALGAIASPQGYQPFRPYDGSNGVASSTSSPESANNAAGSGALFGNDGAGLDNGVDDNNGTPFGIGPGRNGGGSSDGEGGGEDPTPPPDPTPTPAVCGGRLQCCDSSIYGYFAASSPQGQDFLSYEGLPLDTPGLIAYGCADVGSADGCNAALCCPSDQAGFVRLRCDLFSS
ncbi:hypothetical protein BXZ70DRAFT_689489 [Cristinia sonorae]|uniref:Hydrophobin n=1 Tax=Cristinia sonorae TaxID=1940300 RepID=A0A8K0XK02_9AGAR|nr:hypothetical protein BXZ70DRAFT_689489 [Cristinia sonorae]